MNESRMRVFYIEVNGAEAIRQTLLSVDRLIDSRADLPVPAAADAVVHPPVQPPEYQPPALVNTETPIESGPAPSRPSPGRALSEPLTPVKRKSRCANADGSHPWRKMNHRQIAAKPASAANGKVGSLPGWTEERRAKFKATMAAKRGVDLGEARPMHSNSQSQPINPHVIGGGR